MFNTYHFEVTRYDNCKEFTKVEAPTYSIALRIAYQDTKVVATDCKAITLWGGLVVLDPFTPGDHDIPQELALD